MVFGWGKKKEPQKTDRFSAETIQRDISINDIPKILDDLKNVRIKTMVSESNLLRDKILPHFNELKNIAAQLEKDSLNTDDIDKHIKTIVERGKKQVIAIIKEETSLRIIPVKTLDDVLSFNDQISRSLKKIGDVLGRQSRVIHLFAKKYAGKMKVMLSDLESYRKTIQELINNYKKLQIGVDSINKNIRTITKSKESMEKKSKRILDFENSLGQLEEAKQKTESDISKIKNSDDYQKFTNTRQSIQKLESEKNILRRQINDQFTKISRPLGKYEYVSSMDKQQKQLLRILVDDPFAAISAAQKNDIIVILQSVKKGVLSGSVSVKDTEKSVQFLDEITEILESLIQQKESFYAKENSLKEQLDSIDLSNLKHKESELEKSS